jgi:outer membrane murein-binding lipoprotein Lpp
MRKLIIVLILVIFIAGCSGETKKSEFSTNESGMNANVQVESDSLDCKENFDCFKDAAATCKVSKSNIVYNMDTAGMKQKIDFYFEIKGKEGDKCVIYERINNYEADFSGLMEQMSASFGGATDSPEIKAQVDAMNAQVAQMKGKDITCKIPMSQASLLSEKGLDADMSQCTGSLLEMTNSLIPKTDQTTQ